MSEIDFSPEYVELSDIDTSVDFFDKQYVINKKIDSVSIVNCFAVFRANAKGVVCLFPSAQPIGKRINPVFHRWSWAYQLKDYHVLSFSDPGLYYSEIGAAWFLGCEQLDLVEEVADFIRKISKKIDIKENRFMLYGSSMGGFSALMVASHLDGAMAVAEVPQIDLKKYPVKSAIDSIESCVLNGRSIFDYSESFPERVDVFARFKKMKYVPPFRILTNMADVAFFEHIDFYKSIGQQKSDFLRIGDASLTVTANQIGHKPLPTSIGIGYVRSILAEGWQTLYSFDYKSLIDLAVNKAKEVRYIRTVEDTQKYEELKGILYSAARANENADWPYLKLCSVIKLWSNSFNVEILDAALAAFNRRQSLEAFIYACRGYLYNFDAAVAKNKIDELQISCLDAQTANVGNIFKSILFYDAGDYKSYASFISLFLDCKGSDFNPYISIPVSTVYTGGMHSVEKFSPDDVLLLGRKLIVTPFEVSNSKYIISVSCDEKYFFEYARYLVMSFSAICSKEAILHLSIVSGNCNEINSALQEWGAKNVFFTIQNIDSGANTGPVASLLRFCHVSQMLFAYGLPVFVLDIDAVIKNPLGKMLESHRGADICSRVLGRGVAPWEKYTGGFALFNPTRVSERVSINISLIANLICESDHKQWWIDQNCFEAGIRCVLESGEDVAIANIFSIRDEYCTMPVGSGEAKKFSLDKALKNIIVD